MVGTEADRRPGREAKLCARQVRFVADNKTAAEGLFSRSDESAVKYGG
jgi:hypothetical protein